MKNATTSITEPMFRGGGWGVWLEKQEEGMEREEKNCCGFGALFCARFPNALMVVFDNEVDGNGALTSLRPTHINLV